MKQKLKTLKKVLAATIMGAIMLSVFSTAIGARTVKDVRTGTAGAYATSNTIEHTHIGVGSWGRCNIGTTSHSVSATGWYDGMIVNSDVYSHTASGVRYAR